MRYQEGSHSYDDSSAMSDFYDEDEYYDEEGTSNRHGGTGDGDYDDEVDINESKGAARQRYSSPSRKKSSSSSRISMEVKRSSTGSVVSGGRTSSAGSGRGSRSQPHGGGGNNGGTDINTTAAGVGATTTAKSNSTESILKTPRFSSQPQRPAAPSSPAKCRSQHASRRTTGEHPPSSTNRRGEESHNLFEQQRSKSEHHSHKPSSTSPWIDSSSPSGGRNHATSTSSSLFQSSFLATDKVKSPESQLTTTTSSSRTRSTNKTPRKMRMKGGDDCEDDTASVFTTATSATSSRRVRKSTSSSRLKGRKRRDEECSSSNDSGDFTDEADDDIDDDVDETRTVGGGRMSSSTRQISSSRNNKTPSRASTTSSLGRAKSRSKSRNSTTPTEEDSPVKTTLDAMMAAGGTVGTNRSSSTVSIEDEVLSFIVANVKSGKSQHGRTKEQEGHDEGVNDSPNKNQTSRTREAVGLEQQTERSSRGGREKNTSLGNNKECTEPMFNYDDEYDFDNTAGIVLPKEGSRGSSTTTTGRTSSPSKKKKQNPDMDHSKSHSRRSVSRYRSRERDDSSHNGIVDDYDDPAVAPAPQDEDERTVMTTRTRTATRSSNKTPSRSAKGTLTHDDDEEDNYTVATRKDRAKSRSRRSTNDETLEVSTTKSSTTKESSERTRGLRSKGRSSRHMAEGEEKEDETDVIQTERRSRGRATRNVIDLSNGGSTHRSGSVPAQARRRSISVPPSRSNDGFGDVVVRNETLLETKKVPSPQQQKPTDLFQSGFLVNGYGSKTAATEPELNKTFVDDNLRHRNNETNTSTTMMKSPKKLPSLALKLAQDASEPKKKGDARSVHSSMSAVQRRRKNASENHNGELPGMLSARLSTGNPSRGSKGESWDPLFEEDDNSLFSESNAALTWLPPGWVAGPLSAGIQPTKVVKQRPSRESSGGTGPTVYQTETPSTSSTSMETEDDGSYEYVQPTARADFVPRRVGLSPLKMRRSHGNRDDLSGHRAPTAGGRTLRRSSIGHVAGW